MPVGRKNMKNTMNNEDENINYYMPSILNPRTLKKQELLLTQSSAVSRCSLSLKRPNGSSIAKPLFKVTHTNKEHLANISTLVQESERTTHELPAELHVAGGASLGFSAAVDVFQLRDSSTHRSNIDCNKSHEKRSNINTATGCVTDEVTHTNKQNSLNISNLVQETQKVTQDLPEELHVADDLSLGYSPVKYLNQAHGSSSPLRDINCKDTQQKKTDINGATVYETDELGDNNSDRSCIVISSATESTRLINAETQSVSTYVYDVDKPSVRVSFGVHDCGSVDVNATNGTIKKFTVCHKDKSTNIDCELVEGSQILTKTEVDENMNETSIGVLKRTALAVSLEIKRQRLTHNYSTENSKVLILNTNAIEKISHIIVQPPNYKFVKGNIPHKIKNRNRKSVVQNETLNAAGLKQLPIERYLSRGNVAALDVTKQVASSSNDGAEEMSKNSGVFDAVKCNRMKSSRTSKKELNELPKSAVLHSKRELVSPRRQDIKTTGSVAASPRTRHETLSAHSPRKNVESIHFSLPLKSKSNKTSLSPKNIPHHKIVAGTHFAVDAFSYGDIPDVKHYFLTHFHSDHYSGLKKSFSKLLYCSHITAELCIARLGVNCKNIRRVDVDETFHVDGVEVAAVDANHCPGALMFVFTLLNGKSALHTGDFRACPSMESYPVFWNKDIHTVYLDTTYCNPRYDFPTQEQSLEMALYILKKKKMDLEKVGKKFSSVLIVCGTYTIGKEKFFLGLSRRVGCSVWACPEKERVLQIVEGAGSGREAPQECQLHVVPMRDLTHEKLRSYLDSWQGAFAEVVAFKPSGWENGKNSKVERDFVTIHGIPYSEHSSFSELIRFIKFVKPRQVVPTVDISGGVKAVQKYFPCPLVYKDERQCQSRLTDYFTAHTREQADGVT